MKKVLFCFTAICTFIYSNAQAHSRFKFKNQIIDSMTENLPEGLYADILTDSGRIICQLEFEKAPLTVCSFSGLAEGKITNSSKEKGVPFFDGLTFHRVEPNFVIQGGDPQGNGMGGPGYSFADEFDKSLRHNSGGILSMANSGKNTNGSQFFITHTPTPHLDDRHSVFGKVVMGMDVVNKVKAGNKIKSMLIIRKGVKAAAFANDDAAFSKLKQKAEAAEAEKAKLSDMALNDVEVKKRFPKAVKTASGLWYVVNNPGTGEKPKVGQTVKVHYKGTFTDGNIFDQSAGREPLEFQLGKGRVIPGWDEGIALMKKGAKFTLIIPSKLAYGPQGYPGAIPPSSTLIFETELVDIK